MFYDIVIHPSRIELVHRYFSPEKNILESKKLGYTDIDFKFGVKTVEDGENYGTVKKVIEDLLAPYKEEFNCVNIIPPVTFFQFKEFPCSNENADFEEYISWEAFQMATDVPEHYKFGFIYEEKDSSVFISLVRKKVYYYFRNLLHEIFPEGIEMKLISSYRSLSDSDHLIEISKDLTAPFAAGASKETSVAPVSIDDEPARKRSLVPVFAVVVILVLTAETLYILKPGLFKPEAVKENIVTEAADNQTVPAKLPDEELSTEVSETEIEINKDTVTVIEDIDEEITEESAETSVPERSLAEDEKAAVTEVPDVSEKEPEVIPVKEEKRPPSFWETISLLSNFKADSILFESGSITMYLTGTESVAKAEQIDETGSFVYDISDNIVKISHETFKFAKYDTTINRNNFIDIKNENYLLFSDNTYTTYKINSKDDFKDLFDDLGKKKVEFKSFRIVEKENIYYLTVDFD